MILAEGKEKKFGFGGGSVENLILKKFEGMYFTCISLEVFLKWFFCKRNKIVQWCIRSEGGG